MPSPGLSRRHALPCVCRRGYAVFPIHFSHRVRIRSGAAPPAAICQSEPPPENLRRSEEHTSELQSLMRISYAVFCLKKKKKKSRKTLLNKKYTTEYIINRNILHI